MLPGSDMQSAAIHRSAWPPYRPTRSGSIDNYLYHLIPRRCFQWKSPQIMKEETRLQTNCISHVQLPRLCNTEDKNSSHAEGFEAWTTEITTPEPNAHAPTCIWAPRSIFASSDESSAALFRHRKIFQSPNVLHRDLLERWDNHG